MCFVQPLTSLGLLSSVAVHFPCATSLALFEFFFFPTLPHPHYIFLFLDTPPTFLSMTLRLCRFFAIFVPGFPFPFFSPFPALSPRSPLASFFSFNGHGRAFCSSPFSLCPLPQICFMSCPFVEFGRRELCFFSRPLVMATQKTPIPPHVAPLSLFSPPYCG